MRSLEQARMERRLYDASPRTDKSKGSVGVFLAEKLGGNPEDIIARLNLLKMGLAASRPWWSRIDSGELTPSEAARLARQEQRQTNPKPRRRKPSSKSPTMDPSKSGYNAISFEAELDALQKQIDALRDKATINFAPEPITDAEVTDLIHQVNEHIGTFLKNHNFLRADGLVLHTHLREFFFDFWFALDTLALGCQASRNTSRTPTIGRAKYLTAFETLGFKDVSLSKPPLREAMRKAFRAIARRTHPDVHGTGNHPAFMHAHEAYKTLMHFYDQKGK